MSFSVPTFDARGGRVSDADADAAARAIADDGLVVLRAAVDPDHLAALWERMETDLDAILARPDAPFQFTTSNVQQDPPPFAPHVFRDVVSNDAVVAVTRRVLGPGVKNSFYSGNTALPSPLRQPVHVDTGHLWAGAAHAHPPVQLVVNVPVVDTTPENGSTEIWPGTHHDTTYGIHEGSAKVAPEKLEARRALCPPIQPTLARGDVLIRDIRLWHAGTPNHTDRPRPMLAMIHTVGWWQTGAGFPIAPDVAPIFEHPELRHVCRVVDGPIDYLGHHGAYDLQR